MFSYVYVLVGQVKTSKTVATLQSPNGKGGKGPNMDVRSVSTCFKPTVKYSFGSKHCITQIYRGPSWILCDITYIDVVSKH